MSYEQQLVNESRERKTRFGLIHSPVVKRNPFRIGEESFPGPKVNCEAILKAVCRMTMVRKHDILGPWRSKHIVDARWVSAYLMRTYTSASFPSIGRRLGGRDHSGIIHAYKSVKADPTKYQNTINKVMNTLC